MPIHNAESSELLETLADLLAIEEANASRVRGYPLSMAEMIRERLFSGAQCQRKLSTA